MSETVETAPEPQAMPQEDRSLFFAPTTIRNCLASWLVPGLGYFLSGRKRAGIIMVSALIGAVLLGFIQGGDLYPLLTDESGIRKAGSLCQLGMGLPYILAQLMGEVFGFSRPSPLSMTYDYGTNYFLIAGMLNWLSVMDVFDISVNRK